MSDVVDQYAVQVKAEYILATPPIATTTAEMAERPHGDNRDTNDFNNNNNNGNKKKKKKDRGQNKKRPRDKVISYGDKMCRSIVRGEACPFVLTDKGCKYNHDVKEMLATRPPDLHVMDVEGGGGATWFDDVGIGCPNYTLRGHCSYGIMCRLGSFHLNMSTGQNLRREEKAKEEEAKETTTTATATTFGNNGNVMNVLSKETQLLLRKNKYPFVCKRHFEVQKNSNNRKEDKVSVDDTTSTMDHNATTTTTTTTTTTVTTPALPAKERKLIDFRNKVYIAPLTTVGNLPFRRIMKSYGADITCGEMALADQLLAGKPSEWALLKRHPSEDVFGVQIAAGHGDLYTRVAEILGKEEGENMAIDFLDMNLGCPLDMVCDKGAGASLMLRDKKLRSAIEGMAAVLNCPITIKIRNGWNDNQPFAHELVPKIQSWGIDSVGAIMIHGRSRLQRYSREANWEYIAKVARSQSAKLEQQIPVIGNGDVFSYLDYERILKLADEESGIDYNNGSSRNNLSPTAMLARGALIKPWLPTEIKERRHWDISATERLDILKDFVKFGLEHWGSDQQGVNHTRRFLLEWMSFLYRYVPVGMLEVLPQQLNARPPNNMCGRSELETLMFSKNCADWIKISTMLLGPVPEGFQFEPKHKANSYQTGRD